MLQTIVYFAYSVDETYECAYSILKYLDVYNLKPPASHRLVIYTGHPEILEAYGSFFSGFELKPLIQTADRITTLDKLKGPGPVLCLEPNAYLVKELDEAVPGANNKNDEAIRRYDDLKEFRILLRNFFGRYQEESVPNQIKLIHHIDAKKIEEQKKQFEQLPLASRWLKKLMGKGWSIANYQRKI
jgi:hypothetical protein